MYISLRSKHLEFHLLCRCAPVAVDSGLRPETHQSRPGKTNSKKTLNGPRLCFIVLLVGMHWCGGNQGTTAVSARPGGILGIDRCLASPVTYLAPG